MSPVDGRRQILPARILQYVFDELVAAECAQSARAPVRRSEEARRLVAVINREDVPAPQQPSDSPDPLLRFEIHFRRLPFQKSHARPLEVLCESRRRRRALGPDEAPTLVHVNVQLAQLPPAQHDAVDGQCVEQFV